METKIKKQTIYRKILGSLNNGPDGWSARKLAAFYAVNFGASYITVRLLPEKDAIYGLVAWLIFALLCLSVITAENIIKFRNGGDKKPKDSEEAEA